MSTVTPTPTTGEVDLGPAVAVSRTVGQVLAIFWTVITATSATWSLYDVDALFMVFGSVSCLIATLPLMSRRYDLLSPWSFIVLAIYIGCGLRSVFVAFRIDGPRSINELFLLGRETTYFTWPSLLFILGLALTTATYPVSSRPVARSKREQTPWRFNRTAPLVIGVTALAGAVAFFMYTQRTGGLSLATLSAKRTRVDGLDLQGYESFGALSAFCDLSSYAFWAAIAMVAKDPRPFRLISLRGATLAALFVNAAALPIYSSVRSDAGYILIIGIAIYLCLRVGPKSVGRAIRLGGAAVVVLVSALTLVRAGTGLEDSQFSVTNTVGSTFVYNRNFTDIPTSAQIMRAVPDILEPAHGSTYTAWLVAPIPRSLWPDKPLISSGPIIGVRVFNTAGSGVRPGFIPEAYWNFGVGGVAVGGVLLGLGLRRLYELMLPRLDSPFWVVLYCGALLRFGASIFSVGVGYAIFGAVLSLAGLATVMSLCGTRVTSGGRVHSSSSRRGLTARAAPSTP